MASVRTVDGYITVAEIDLSEIKKIDFATCKEPKETLDSFYKRQEIKPDFVMNGGFFALSTGVPVFNFKDENEVKAQYNTYRWGMAVIGDKNVVYGCIDRLPEARDFLCGYPVLLDNGEIQKLDYDKSIIGKNPRTVFGINDSKLFLITIDGRQTGKPGATMQETAEIARSLGCKFAINCDGGGSTRLMKDGNTINSPIENRAVDNVIAVYLNNEPKQETVIKEENVMKIYLSPSTQEHNVNKNLGYVEETEMNLVTDILEVELKRHGIITYRNNPSMNLTQVCKDSNSKKVDLHFAIHSNAGGGKGTECYICARGGKAEKYANTIYNEVAALTPHSDRGVKVNAALYEVSYTDAPAVLIELDFHDNDTIAKWIQNNRKPLAIAMCKGILKQAGIAYIEEKVEEKVEEPAAPAPTTPNNNIPWYNDAQWWAKEQGISDGTRPEEPATRAEVWQMLYNYERSKNK